MVERHCSQPHESAVPKELANLNSVVSKALTECKEEVSSEFFTELLNLVLERGETNSNNTQFTFEDLQGNRHAFVATGTDTDTIVVYLNTSGSTESRITGTYTIGRDGSAQFNNQENFEHNGELSKTVDDAVLIRDIGMRAIAELINR